MIATPNWTEVRLVEVIRRSFSGPSPTCEERNVRGNEWGVLKTTCSTWAHGWDSTKHKVLPTEFWGKDHLEVRSGDSIITKAGPRRRVAVPAFVSNVQPRIIPSGKMICLRPDPARIEPGFLALALTDRRTQAFLDQRTTGMAESQVNFENADLLDAPLWLPSLDDQRRLLEPLNDVDNLIATLEHLITKKQAIKQGMMQQLLTGRTRLPGFNGSWGSVPFEALARPSKERVDPQTMPNGTQLIELEHIESGSGHIGRASTAAEAVSFKSVYRPGDVLFGKLRPYLRKFALVETDGLCSTEIWVLRAEKPNESAFVRYVVESDSFIGAASGGYGTHMPRSDWNVVRRFPIPLPEPSEQKAIAGVLLDADQEIRVLIRRLAKARSLKSGMMQQLLTGRVRLPVEVES